MANNAAQRIVSNRAHVLQLMRMDERMDNMTKNARRDEDGILVAPARTNVQSRAVNPNLIAERREEIAMKHPNMPAAILESFAQNPGQDPNSVYGGVMGTSILDSVLPSTPMNEATSAPQAQVQASYIPTIATGNIDYQLIESMIDKSVKKYVSAMAKKLMTESKGKGGEIKAMRLGESFTFVDGDGNVYEAELKFKRNINEERK